MKNVKIGLIGCGVVGGGLIDLFKRNGRLMKERAGFRQDVKWVCAKNLKEIKDKVKSYQTTDDYTKVINDPEISVGDPQLPTQEALLRALVAYPEGPQLDELMPLPASPVE